jgi:hypothetical protein
MHQWFPSLSLLPWVSFQSLSMRPKQTNGRWSWSPNLKHQASSYPGSSIGCLAAISTAKTLFKRWVNNCNMTWVRSELQALNCIGSQKPQNGSYPEPDEYNPPPNPLSSTWMLSSHLCLALFKWHLPLRVMFHICLMHAICLTQLIFLLMILIIFDD